MPNNPIILPKNLKKGDKIAIISPAGSVQEEQLTKTINLIREKGYKPVLGKNVYNVHDAGYSYAGTEEERLEDIQWAFDSDDISAIWASRGGYGCVHLIKHLNLEKFRKNPKWYVGYSDNTVIQALLFKEGFASIHGQTIKTSSFGVSPESYQSIFDILEGKPVSYELDEKIKKTLQQMKGQLIGGNLALIYSLMGTEHELDFQDKILFIEDIGESFYALDRMLMNLDLAGVFQKINGLIVGGFTNMGDEKDNINYEESFDPQAYSIIEYRIKEYKFPKIYHFPNGHIFNNYPLIIGDTVS